MSRSGQLKESSRHRAQSTLERLRAQASPAAPARLRAAHGSLRDRAPEGRAEALRDRLSLRQRRACADLPDQLARAAADFADRLAFAIPALAHEAQAVNEVKRVGRFTVVVGNPPYSKSSQNQGPWIDFLMEDYKRTVRAEETQIQALSDDYVKFIRFAQFCLGAAGVGVLAFITNNGYLDGPLFRDMRRSLLDSFAGIRIVNFHGDSRKGLQPPDGQADENVFDIQQGVATMVGWRPSSGVSHQDVAYAGVWGTRAQKYEACRNPSALEAEYEPIHPQPPNSLLIPVATDLETEYNRLWHLYDVFGSGKRDADNHESYGAGFVTQQDRFAIGFNAADVVQNVKEFLDPAALDGDLWERFRFCSTNQWDFDRAKAELRVSEVERGVRRCLYRPFDYRYTVFDRNICTIIRRRITSQFDVENVALLSTRRVTRPPFNNVFVSDTYPEYKVASHDRNTIVFPLWIRGEAEALNLFGTRSRLNLNPSFVETLSTNAGYIWDAGAGLPHGVPAESVLGYVYAVLHSPAYRRRYEAFLCMDFPRVPAAVPHGLFVDLSRLGSALIDLHLLRGSGVDLHAARYVGEDTPRVETVNYDSGVVSVTKDRSSSFVGVPPDVWGFHIGGYQVCEKWLKDRKGRRLTRADVAHYQQVVGAVSTTLRLMREIDDAIDRHGGWPAAFVPANAETGEDGAE